MPASPVESFQRFHIQSSEKCSMQVISRQMGLEELRRAVGRLWAEARELTPCPEPAGRSVEEEADLERRLHGLRQEVGMLEESMLVTHPALCCIRLPAQFSASLWVKSSFVFRKAEASLLSTFQGHPKQILKRKIWKTYIFLATPHTVIG
jgi:hypothetical protein